jgi:uncharacterized cupredoxin-like copper-binding protein
MKTVLLATASLAFVALPAAHRRAHTLPPAAAVHDVLVVATEYAFAAPDTIAAGMTTFTLRDDGKELHHLVIVRLDSGHTRADFAKAAEVAGPAPGWMVFVGGPNPPTPGGVAKSTTNLLPGHYLLVCFIPAKDGQPHVAKGMIREMTVVGTPSSASLPPSDAMITLAEYSYAISRPIAAGSRVIAVHNEGTQTHEAILMRLAPGKTVGDVLTWIAGGLAGPPPALPVGGMSLLSPGGTAEFQAALTPGEYGLICVIPDGKDGKPHAVHGMMKQFTVTGT